MEVKCDVLTTPKGKVAKWQSGKVSFAKYDFHRDIGVFYKLYIL